MRELSHAKLGLLAALLAGAALAQGQSSTNFGSPLTIQGAGSACTISTTSASGLTPVASVSCPLYLPFAAISTTFSNSGITFDGGLPPGGAINGGITWFGTLPDAGPYWIQVNPNAQGVLELSNTSTNGGATISTDCQVDPYHYNSAQSLECVNGGVAGATIGVIGSHAGCTMGGGTHAVDVFAANNNCSVELPNANVSNQFKNCYTISEGSSYGRYCAIPGFDGASVLWQNISYNGPGAAFNPLDVTSQYGLYLETYSAGGAGGSGWLFKSAPPTAGTPVVSQVAQIDPSGNMTLAGCVKGTDGTTCDLTPGTTTGGTAAGTWNFTGTLQVGGVVVDSSPDLFLQFNDPVTVVSNTSDFETWGPSQHSMTLKSCTCAVNVAGGGTGTETWKVTSGAAGTGTVFMTVVIPCASAAGANCTSCTVNTAAVPTNTTLHAAVTTACTTADIATHILVSATEP